VSNVLSPPTNGAAHKTATSTGVADVKTIAKVEGSTGMWISAKTTAARITLDGETPNPATPLGQVIPAGLAPQFFPFAADVKVCSDVAGNSELNVLYTS
jgi:hypothetical protein